MTYDLAAIRSGFPILSREVNGRPLVYLDNGASAQKPQQVIDAITEAYAQNYANVHRGLHTLSSIATERYEAVRSKIAAFLGASEGEILYTTGATHGFNLISYAWAAPRLEAGDEIILSVMEHHANIVPWHFLRERMGVVLKWVECDAAGQIDPQAIAAQITKRTRLITVTHMSNVTGSIQDIKAITALAQERGIPVMVDGAQAAVHMQVNVAELGCDFYVITGHKLYGPTGSGAIYVKKERLEEMRPFMGGGDMIAEVTRERITYNHAPHKFEAGTPGIVQVIGLGAALDYLTGIGMERIAAHEADLQSYAATRLSALPWLRLQGQLDGAMNNAPRGAIFSFTMPGAGHAHDLSTILDQKGIAVRAGHHCAQPLMQFFGENATCRASFGLYNSRAEVDALIDGLSFCHELLG